MATAPNHKTLVNEELNRAGPVVDALVDVLARWWAVYTVELFSMLEERGLALPSRAPRETGAPPAEDMLAAAPAWVRAAYEQAKTAAEPVHSDEREVRGRLIKNRLALALKKQGMTQSDLARKMGKNPSHVSRVFRDPQRCKLSTLTAIADALGVDISDILSGFPDRG